MDRKRRRGNDRKSGSPETTFFPSSTVMLDNTIVSHYYWIMIVSWADSETETIWNGRFSRLLPQDIQRTAKRKLIQIHSAIALTDLRIPPGNLLEKLLGDKKDEWSIRINDSNNHQMGRICFLWENGNALNVGIVDYH